MPGYPVVASVLPASGSTGGGTPVTILGRHFTGTTAVEFGGVPAASFTVVDDNTITAVTPAVAGGIAAVDITNAKGSSGDPLILTDDSGNSNHGSYPHQLTVGPGLVPDGDSWAGLLAGLDPGPSQSVTLLDPSTSCAVEFWYQSDSFVTMQVTFGSSVVDEFMTFWGPGVFNPRGVLQTRLSMQVSGPVSTFFDGTSDPFAYDGVPHQVVTVWNPDPSASSVDLYIDGAFVATYEYDDPAAPIPQPAPSFAEPFDRFNIAMDASLLLDEMAFYPTAPSPSDIAAHYAAASSSYDDYATAVLANSPSAFYRFDDERRSGEFTFFEGGWRIGRN